MDTPALQARAHTNISDIVSKALEHNAPHRALVVFDTAFGLTEILTNAYRATLPAAQFLNFDETPKEDILAVFANMTEGDLVVLVQSGSFRLDDFRIRLHLFNRKLKVIEHTHLHRNSEPSWDTYIDALAYDPEWYRTTGHAVKQRLEHTNVLEIHSGNSILTVTGGLEMPKLNIGDYSGMENIGGTFPIGEVFTEAKDFILMNGSILIYGMAGPDFCINMYEPFRVDIHEGLVVGWGENTPEAFVNIISAISAVERPLVREIGFGLNRAITRERYVEDITAYERILGMHLSLGEKHSVYKTPGIKSDKCRFHVDIFPVVDSVLLDGTQFFVGGKYLTDATTYPS